MTVNLQLLTMRTILNMPFQLNQTNIILLLGDLKMVRRQLFFMAIIMAVTQVYREGASKLTFQWKSWCLTRH